MSSPIWGPFDSAPEAAQNLSKFTDMVLDPSMGVTWLSNGTLYALRPPRYDSDGNGQIITFEMRQFSSAPKPPTKGSGQNVKNWFWQKVMNKEKAIQQFASSEGHAAKAWIGGLYSKAVGKDLDDTKGIGYDILAVGLSAALLLTGTAEILGVIAALGGAGILFMDSVAYVTELSGHDETADTIKDITFYPRCVAMIATLPDAIWNVGKVLAEGGKMSTEFASSNATAARAAADAGRSTAAVARSADALEAIRAAARAKKYAEIGERARLRAVATQRKLAFFLSANAAGRVLIAPSTMLLIKEVKEDDKQDRRGEVHAWLSRYVFHVTDVHREKRA